MASSPERTEFRIVEDDLAGTEIQELLRLHADGMRSASPAGACHFLDVAGLTDPLVTVWSAWDGDELAACGALKEIGAAHGEVKSMRTAPQHLGRGAGRMVLDRIVTTAQRRGYDRLSLETGTGVSFAAAIGLYESVGFRRGEPFGSYEENGFSQFFALRL